MPVNQDGVEVNEDGSEITPEQRETSNWTYVVELENKNKAKALDMDVLVPKDVPHNIPYLEVYRTDELYAKDYVSPFMKPPSDSETGTNTTGQEGSDSSEGGGDSSSSSSSSSSSQTPKHDTPHSSKSKNNNLSNELKSVLKNHYKPTTNFTTLLNRYMSCKTNKVAIGLVAVKSANNLKKGTDVDSLNNAVLRIKRKYS